MLKDTIIIIRGGGDIATGIISSLFHSGFRVLVLETAKPTTIRRLVAVSSAIYTGIHRVEDMEAQLASDYTEAEAIWKEGRLPVLIDENCNCLSYVKPRILIDAILAKKNLGTHKGMADYTIGVGPGFEAGVDVHAVIETMRGHTLGRIIEKGCAIPNTGIPGLIAGHDEDRVIHAPASGTIQVVKDITSPVKKDDTIAVIRDENNHTTLVPASIDGIVRGMIIDGFPVKKGLKIADIDPRDIEPNNCFTVSDKARCIGGSCLEAVMRYLKDELC